MDIGVASCGCNWVGRRQLVDLAIVVIDFNYFFCLNFFYCSQDDDAGNDDIMIMEFFEYGFK